MHKCHLELSCGFLTLEVAPFQLAPKTSLGQAINGTTSNEEIPTTKFSDVTLHKRVPVISRSTSIKIL